jgi:hypothetical protein
MCARCPIGGRYPFYPWPGQRPTGGDLGPPPDVGAPDHGAAPPIRWFPADVPKPHGLFAFRRDGKPRFLLDGR